MNSQKRVRSCPKRFEFHSRLPVPRRSVGSAQYIQLVPILNPRFLYLIDFVNQESGDSFFHDARFTNQKINAALLDLCVGVLSDDSILPQKITKIPMTSISNVSKHISDAYELLPDKVSEYSPFVRIPEEYMQRSSHKLDISLNWILYRLLWDENRWTMSWENYFDEFHDGDLPDSAKIKEVAENLLRSKYFRLFARRNPDFLSFSIPSDKTECAMRLAILIAGLYKNGEDIKDPYASFIESGAMTAVERVNLDFNLETIFTENYFKNGQTSDTIYSNMFHLFTRTWKEPYEKEDQDLLLLPLGRLYKQIIDSRFSRLLKFFANRMPEQLFQKEVECSYKTFVSEYLIFMERFWTFIWDKSSSEYATYFQYEFEARLTIDLNRLIMKFFAAILPYYNLDVEYRSSSSFIRTIFRLYNQNFSTLQMTCDLKTVEKYLDPRSKEKRPNIFYNVVYEKCSQMNTHRLKMQEVVDRKQKQVQFAWINISVIRAFLRHRPRYFLASSTADLVILVKIISDWKSYFLQDNPCIYQLYMTELLLRSIRTKISKTCGLSNIRHKRLGYKVCRTKESRSSSKRRTKELRKI